jgi:hypothetical protein
MFLLPDGNQFLQPVDAFETRIECRAPVRGRHDHHHAGFSHQHTAQPMHHGHRGDFVSGCNLASDLGHQLERHRFVTLVIEAKGRTALGVVADDTFKRDHGALSACLQTRDHGAGIDGFASEREIAAALRNLHGLDRCASAHRRQKRDLIAIFNLGR